METSRIKNTVFTYITKEDMKSIKQIKDMVAKDHGYHDYDTVLKMFRDGVISENSFNDFMDELINDIKADDYELD